MTRPSGEAPPEYDLSPLIIFHPCNLHLYRQLACIDFAYPAAAELHIDAQIPLLVEWILGQLIDTVDMKNDLVLCNIHAVDMKFGDIGNRRLA